MTVSIKEVEKKGFYFKDAKAWIDRKNPQTAANDAALMTAPNVGVPKEFLLFMNPEVIEVLQAPLGARSLGLGEVKKGDWTTAAAQFPVMEMTGRTAPYTDFSPAGVSGVNYNFLQREQYRFSTHIYYGDFEEAVHGAARINLVADKQRAAAFTIDTDANKFYLFGVEGLSIYGFLNDPNMPAAITANATGTGSSTAWADKNTQQIYEDVLTLFSELVSQSMSWINNSSRLVLVMSPELSVRLASATDFNVSVMDMLNKYFTNLTIVTIPELSQNVASQERMIMFSPEVRGMKAGELAFSEKLRTGRVVPDLSSYKQKFTSTTYGTLIYLPWAFAQMTGM